MNLLRMSGLIATKVGMSRVFLETGEAVPVTYLKVEPNVIVRTKTIEKDGYNAIVLGVGPREWTSRKGKKNIRYRIQKEWRVESLDGMEPGKQLTVELLPDTCTVTVTGVSKGKGFTGVIKRHGFAGGPGSHGSHFHREPGSIGMRELPGRVHKGKRMAGRSGRDTVTISHRPVMVRDVSNGVIAVKGPVPGPNGTPIFLTLES